MTDYQYKSQQEHYPERSSALADSYVHKQNTKLTQVIQQCFSKAVKVVLQARTLPDNATALLNSTLADDSASGNKINRWFNLHIQNTQDVSKDELKLWKSNNLTTMPPMIIETYLDLRQLTQSQTVVLNDENGNPWTVAKSGGKKEVVLERWLVEFDQSEVSGSIVDELPLIYKQAIILFRTIYAFARLMPTFKLRKRLMVNKSSSKLNKISLGNKILDGKKPISSKGRIGLSKSIIPTQMLTTESHMSSKQFEPIQTSMGTLKVSIAYRNHNDFCIHDNEEVLSTHFISMDSTPIGASVHKANNTSMSVSPCSSGHPALREASPSKRAASPTSGGASTGIPSVIAGSISKPSFQPFKIGSISNSPPQGSHNVSSGSYGGSVERKISITSNKSTSNASLAAVLRNPRGSSSSTHTTSNIPIANSGNSGHNTNIYNMSFPRSISSSHGSNMQHDDSVFSNPDSTTNTPKFSTSFGSRASRRFSNTSIRQSTPVASTLAGTGRSVNSSIAPLSGLYIDDDISDFVRMIDSKGDLRFSSSLNTSGSAESKPLLTYNQPPPPGSDALNRFQMLKSQHQQLGESVSASLILHHNQLGSGSGSGIGITGSRNSSSSRKSSHSMRSPSPSMSGLYENSHTRVGERAVASTTHTQTVPANSSSATETTTSATTITPDNRGSIAYSNTSFLRSTNKLLATAYTSTTNAHATIDSINVSGVSGLATSPSMYQRTREAATIHYENVFEDDDDDDDVLRPKSSDRSESKAIGTSRDVAPDSDFDDDDLLFTMSDMNMKN
ncbi:autophagy-related protein 13 [Scheffersomyces xylosifermentans]|uniref:autophagy-related protein 13 n=1 Tax=Scheffersomyces xylosifermentans TaxID=1304137 RepID=UPI00315CDDC1